MDKPQTIRAKFRCDRVESSIPGNNFHSTAWLNAVYANSDGSVNEENKSFSKYTPSGNLVITISEETPAHLFFEEGKEYYLDFSEAK